MKTSVARYSTNTWQHSTFETASIGIIESTVCGGNLFPHHVAISFFTQPEACILYVTKG
jgi:hypothetical protein